MSSAPKLVEKAARGSAAAWPSHLSAEATAFCCVRPAAPAGLEGGSADAGVTMGCTVGSQSPQANEGFSICCCGARMRADAVRLSNPLEVAKAAARAVRAQCKASAKSIPLKRLSPEPARGN